MMTMSKQLVFFGLTVLAVLLLSQNVAILYGQDAKQQPDNDPLVALSSTDSDVRAKAVVDLANERSARISNLLSLAEWHAEEQRGANMGVAAAAIRVLGNERAQEAIPFFVKHLTFIDTTKKLQLTTLHATTMESYYSQTFPCVGALIANGSPSVAPLLLQIESRDINATPSSNNEESMRRNPEAYEAECAKYVMLGVLGHDLALTCLRQRMETTTDEVTKLRLAAFEKLVEGPQQ
jgi:hypothetical protein